MRSARVLITGVGGIGGVNFVNALRLAESQVDLRLYLVGTDHNPYYIHFANVDARYRTPPRHDDPNFLSTILDIIRKHGIEFLHPHPSVEANVVASNRGLFDPINVRTYLPSPESIAPPDKAVIVDKMTRAGGVPVPRTMSIKTLDDIDEAFSRLGGPLWIRARRGAGGRLSLRVNNPEEAKLWVRLNVLQGRASIEDFIIQEYLPGRDVAFDSLWYRGRLVTSYARERIEYPFKHISLSGITGTPSVARTISDEEVNKVGVRAVLALDPPEPPHGFYSVDLKEDPPNGRFRVTEVDGKWHTTAPLWGPLNGEGLPGPEV
ncbi:hypothetical protein [Vulcanisaeta distributa]|uniref:hypothetical protein n=1 Tax=Vulcanisaeta distributa TaxID=164451 RepID=UPI000B12F9C1|nr:hypothetical protein [Vulcanisaeta distributa]